MRLAVRKVQMFPASREMIGKVIALENIVRQAPQLTIDTDHVIHGGMYARTITIPKGAALVGALIKIPTMVIVSGHCTVTIGDDVTELCGYQVLPASAGRKQAWVAHQDTDVTMIFPTTAKTVEEAETQFTDDANQLMSRQYSERDTFTYTGE